MEEDKTASKLYETLHQNNMIDMLPELSKMAAIFAVIPATSCSVEQAFSGLRRLKTYYNISVSEVTKWKVSCLAVILLLSLLNHIIFTSIEIKRTPVTWTCGYNCEITLFVFENSSSILNLILQCMELSKIWNQCLELWSKTQD